MTTNTNTMISVSYDSNHHIQYLPSNTIEIGKDTYETVVWKGVPPLQFKSTQSSASGPLNVGTKIKFAPEPTQPMVYTDTITMIIDNTGGPDNVSAQVTLGVADMTTQPPVVIDGGGSIRNKGTSIWVWDLAIIFLGALAIGFFLGRMIGAKPKTGQILGILVGVAASAVAIWNLFQQVP